MASCKSVAGGPPAGRLRQPEGEPSIRFRRKFKLDEIGLAGSKLECSGTKMDTNWRLYWRFVCFSLEQAAGPQIGGPDQSSQQQTNQPLACAPLLAGPSCSRTIALTG